MKVLILTLGTRGDVQPFVALARGLLDAGHEVTLAAPKMFEGFVHEHGIGYAPIADGPLTVLSGGTPIADVADGGLRAKAALARSLPPLFTEVLRDCWTIAAGLGDLDLIVHNGQVVAGQHVAEKLGVPAVLALPLPIYVPTGDFPWPGQELPYALPRWCNRATFLGMHGPALLFGRTVDRWRAELGLRRRPGRHNPLRRPDGGRVPVLHAISPAVLPRPADWPATAGTTGYWFLDDAATTALSPALEDFLGAGPPPVFAGFGSMSGRDPAATAAIVLDAVARTGTRAVVVTGWGGLTPVDVPDTVFVTDTAPYHLLFPHVAAVVHHGGAGTTAAAAAAGRPQIICPFVADQPFWGRRMAALGVAPAPIRHAQLTAGTLADALARATRLPALNDAATALGVRVRAEQGVKTAVKALEGFVTSPV